ncbi:MAG: ribonuclease domain-containing protein [Candidatus Limiplasma sp.]|nr:ribonuclease domain-containing protein [Candidatus Limiplasma sp.]
MNRWKQGLAILTALALLWLGGTASAAAKALRVDAAAHPVQAGQAYTAMEEVAVYLTRYGCLPDNFITKKQAQALGWDNRLGNLGQVAPGQSIGGDPFGNYEGLLPDAKGRRWTECDIEADGGYRNGKRLVFSNDGLLYYSDDHYASFRPVDVYGLDAAQAEATETPAVTKGKAYLTRDDVAAYLHQYGTLPPNYLTRDQAKALGWSSRKDNLGQVAPGSAIGGDRFENREGLLPAAKGRTWNECDVNTNDGHRSDERLVYSNDGLIYYTPDNHRSFEQLYK